MLLYLVTAKVEKAGRPWIGTARFLNVAFILPAEAELFSYPVGAQRETVLPVLLCRRHGVAGKIPAAQTRRPGLSQVMGGDPVALCDKAQKQLRVLKRLASALKIAALRVCDGLGAVQYRSAAAAAAAFKEGRRPVYVGEEPLHISRVKRDVCGGGVKVASSPIKIHRLALPRTFGELRRRPLQVAGSLVDLPEVAFGDKHSEGVSPAGQLHLLKELDGVKEYLFRRRVISPHHVPHADETHRRGEIVRRRGLLGEAQQFAGNLYQFIRLFDLEVHIGVMFEAVYVSLGKAVLF